MSDFIPEFVSHPTMANVDQRTAKPLEWCQGVAERIANANQLAGERPANTRVSELPELREWIRSTTGTSSDGRDVQECALEYLKTARASVLLHQEWLRGYRTESERLTAEVERLKEELEDQRANQPHGAPA